jgi:hypothetical protein
MGRTERLDPTYKSKWTALLRAAAAPTLAAKADVPTLRVSGWSTAEAQPLPANNNLLADTKAVVRFVAEGAGHVQLQQPFDTLYDGKTDSPEKPWLNWSDINWFAEANPKVSVEFDAFRAQMRLDAITFYEDSKHPESWLRDATLQSWDADREQWSDIMPLLSDAAAHTHRLPKPVEAGKFRVLIPQGMFGNLRWGEIVLHGQALGASHPDVVAKRPRAVLFDESDAFKSIYPYADRWSFVFDGAYAGGRFLKVNGNQTIAPQFQQVYGHTVPTWDFEIAENPAPGQYRWLQFAVKALSPNTRGASIYLWGDGPNATLRLGEETPNLGGIKLQLGDTVPVEWKTYRVDLWDLYKKPGRVRSAYFAAMGDAVGFDQVVLARTENDLPPMSK